MTEPANPAFQPIAEAFAASEAEQRAKDQADAAERARLEAEAQQRTEDRAYFRDCLRRNGETMARRVGRTFGFSAEDMDRMVEGQRAEDEGKAEKIKAKRRKKGSEPESFAGGGGDAPPDKPPADAGGGEEERFRRERSPIKPLPANCPIVPVGYQGTTCYYLNPGKQLVEMAKGSHNADGLRTLFGNHLDWLWVNYPKFNEKTGIQSGWKADRVAESLIAAAVAKGVFDPLGVLRGLGGWVTDDGKLAIHCGNEIVVDGESHAPGFIGDHLYPGARAGAKPIAGAQTDEQRREERAAIDRLLALFDSWNWRDGADAEQDGPCCYAADIDGTGHKLASILTLGWIGAARAGGAIRYRSILWITGDAGSGKTTLQDLIEGVIGSDVVKASDPTAAGIWQTVGQSSRPILVDEAENEAGSNRMQAIVKLARQAATGGLVLRGSSGHTATQFRAQSAFFFSSIIVPSLLSQDMSRMAILELDALPKGAAGAGGDPAFLAHVGRVIMRRLFNSWHRWEATLQAYRAKLAAEGHSARGCDQYGTLLAMADMLRGDEMAHEDTIDAFAKALNREKLDATQYTPSNAEAMLNHLTTVPLDVFRGGTRMTIGALVAYGAGVRKLDGEGVTAKGCREALEAWGIYLDGFETAGGRSGSKARVILPNQNAGLLRLFADTDWRGMPGAKGGWAQAMARLAGAKQENSRRLGGRGWSVPVHTFLQTEGEGF